ncbi:hypothetical protein GCM10018962_86050 [Dactylosporangium matsuzakiense]|uniref:hypothetical protein n=1 Tax=Dactylosporangium matsuzakiense TaxID=53360 RepID=UPI0031E53178
MLGEAAGQATFDLGSGWVLEVVQAGLWVRPQHLNDPADWVRSLPVDVNRCAVIVGAPNAAEIPPPAHTIAEVLEKLPIDARKRAYITVPRGAAPNVFILATGLLDSLPEPGEVELVSPSTPTTSGSFPTVTPAAAEGPRHGRHGDANGPYLVDGRPANGHPSGAHPTVPRSNAPEQDYERGYSDRAGSRTGSFPAFPPADAPTTAFDRPAPPQSHGQQPAHVQQPPQRNGSHHTGAFPAVGEPTGSFSPLTPNGSQRPGRGGGYPATEPPMPPMPPMPPQQPRQRPGETTGSFPAAAFRNGAPDATTPMVPVVPGPQHPAGGPVNGHAPVNGHGPSNGHGHVNGQRPVANGYAAPGGFNGPAQPQPPNGYNGGFNGHAPMHPDVHVAPPRAFHREDQPLHPAGPQQGYSFDAPDYDNHHFEPVSPPPNRHLEEPTGRMPAPRAPMSDESEFDDTGSTATGREIRSHNKKGKTVRADDKTSTQELDRLLGFFDEIRKAKAWDEDSPAPAEHASKRAAAGQPPAGPRRARH